jgi:hypothetical protein
MKSGNLNFLEPSGPLRACNGTALPLHIIKSVYCEKNKKYVRTQCGQNADLSNVRILRQMMRIIANVNCALLGYYAATTGDFLPTFRVNLSVPSSGVEHLKKVNCPNTGFNRVECGR